MHFLLNDAVFELATADPPPLDRLRALSLAHVLTLGAELYAAEPLLHRADPVRARRLVSLIAAKAPQVNAALFVAPSRGCSVEAVTSRLAQASIVVMAELHDLAAGGELTAAAADRAVWGRLAA